MALVASSGKSFLDSPKRCSTCRQGPVKHPPDGSDSHGASALDLLPGGIAILLYARLDWISSVALRVALTVRELPVLAPCTEQTDHSLAMLHVVEAAHACTSAQ